MPNHNQVVPSGILSLSSHTQEEMTTLKNSARRTLSILALTAAALLVGRMACAAPAPSFPPDISTTVAGDQQGDGNFLWSWDVFYGQKPALSHWVLIDLCPEVYEDIVGGSLFGGTGYEFGLDPTTGENGLKFESEDATDSGHAVFGFETQHCWEPGLFDVAFKSGQNVTYQSNVVGPSCQRCDECGCPGGPAPTPEPSSLALLGMGGLPLGFWFRRKTV